MASNFKGFLTYSETGSRLVTRTAQGLLSRDLGRIGIDEAQKKAWHHGVRLFVNGRRGPTLLR